MTKMTQIASAAVLAAFAGLAMASSAQAAGGKAVCIKPHKKFLKTQCGFDQLRKQKTTYLARQRGQIVNFGSGPILKGPAAGQLNGGGRGRN